MIRRLHPADTAEVQAWASTLAQSRDQQLRRLRELLRHARGDHMSERDRAVCRRALELLEDAA